MSLEWFFASVIVAAGSTVFGHFEEKTPLWRRLSKWAIYLGLTALLSRKPGRPWSLVWVFSSPYFGTSFHVWWCRKHGINPLTAEPKDKYYKLRGWT